MIVVMVGTNKYPFDRLVRAADELATLDDVVVQKGTSTVRVTLAESVDFVPFDKMVALVTKARLVITHAGVGSIVVSLSQGQIPLVVPRLARFGEHVDDHQLQIAAAFSSRGFAVSSDDPVTAARSLWPQGQRLAPPLGSGPLVKTIGEFLTEIFTEGGG